jgi:hypothetical protein
MSAWKVQAARITVFPLLASGTPPKSALDLYKAVWGKDPDSFQNQPPGGSPFPNSVAQGAAGKLSRVCQIQPIRVDFTFGPAMLLEGSALPSIEDTSFLKNEMTGLVGSIDNAFQQMPSNRVAVYLQLGREANDYEAGNKAILETMWKHQKVSLKNEEDFLLQINSTRQSISDPSLKLNFITKWSVERIPTATKMRLSSSRPS